jgi:hypothetical protein
MDKILLVVIILSLFFAADVFAQAQNQPNPGMTPDSPLYFLDSFGESISMFFAFGAEKKAQRAMQIAEEKLAEAKVMAEKQKEKALEKANRKYEQFLDIAAQKAQQVSEETKEKVLNMITEKISNHQIILTNLLDKVPEEAQSGIQNAIESSIRGLEEALRAVSGEKQGEQPQQQQQPQEQTQEEAQIQEQTSSEQEEASSKIVEECNLGEALQNLGEQYIIDELSPQARAFFTESMKIRACYPDKNLYKHFSRDRDNDGKIDQMNSDGYLILGPALSRITETTDAKKATVFFRYVKDCATKRTIERQIINSLGGYGPSGDVRTGTTDLYERQCIFDGSFDNYYVESSVLLE